MIFGPNIILRTWLFLKICHWTSIVILFDTVATEELSVSIAITKAQAHFCTSADIYSERKTIYIVLIKHVWSFYSYCNSSNEQCVGMLCRKVKVLHSELMICHVKERSEFRIYFLHIEWITWSITMQMFFKKSFPPVARWGKKRHLLAVALIICLDKETAVYFF